MKAALDGARDIVTETFAENANLLGKLRGHMKGVSVMKAKVVEGKEEAGAKFSDYFNHSEKWANIPSHRMLAMLRARNEDIISLEIETDAEDTSAIKPVERIVAGEYQINPKGSAADAWLMDTVRWAWKVKLNLGLSLDLMTEMREKAEEEAIHVFARNMKDLLLAAPAGTRTTMGLDPGIRTGVKVAVVDDTGKVVDTATVYPFQPRNDVRGAQTEWAHLIRKHKVELIAIGNGTGSRETDKIVADMLALLPNPKPIKVVVSEAGASVYSASESASNELPDLDVSLARRGVHRPPSARPAGRAGEDRAESHRRRPISA